jgi:archaellum component FlaF (FlaF/FlaG flagellin family)
VLNQTPTAVVLTGFRVATVGGKVTVIWTSSGETDTLGFDVQRLIDGQWVTVGHVDAKGPGSTYSVVDANAVPGQTYSYRLVELTATGPNYYEFDNVTGEEFALKALEVTPTGVKLSWLSWAGEKYRVWKCANLASGQYSAIASNIDATPPKNEYVDPEVSNSAFYRIELQQ